MDEDRVHLIIYRGRHEDVVETVPFALIAIGALHPITAAGLLGYVPQVVLSDAYQRRGVVVVVEIAADQDTGIWRDSPNGVDSL